MRKEQVKKNPRDASMTTKQDDNTPKSLELSEGQLEVHFRRLNLAHTRRIYKEVAVRAEKESWSYRDFLALLLAEEVARRKQTRLQRCTRSAHFPFFKTIDEFDFTLQSTLRESVIGSYLGLDFVTEGRSLILHGKTGRGKTHLAVAIGYRAIQNGFETLFTTAAELIEDLSNASKRGHLQESLTIYTRPHALIIDEVGYLTYGPDAANVLFHVVNDRHLRKRPMIFTTNKPLNEWGNVLHDEDMAAAILDRVLERGRFIHLDGPSGRTRHLNLEETLPENTKRLRISGIGGSDFPEPTSALELASGTIRAQSRKADELARNAHSLLALNRKLDGAAGMTLCVRWSNTTYSPGDNAISSLMRIFAESRSFTASNQRKLPSGFFFRMSNGEFMDASRVEWRCKAN
jgi:DNA replication protein DnaC